MSTSSTIHATCRICAHTGDAALYRVREMMYGTREEFDYFECAECGCVQIREIPTDLARFYAGYGSLVGPDVPRGVHGWLKGHRDRYSFTGRGLVGRLASVLRPYPTPGVGRWLTRGGMGRTSRILDVGGGAGHLVLDLYSAGFRELLAIDPFLPEDLSYPGGVRALRRSIHDIEGHFDVIMLHHVLEHVSDPHETLCSVARHLSDRGYCVVRTPNASSDAWETYREHWVQLDPPRHLCVHTIRSLVGLARGAGLELMSVEFDSTEFQFVASEGYRNGIPLVDQGSSPGGRERRMLRERVRQVNRSGRGDQMVFYLRHA